MAKCISTFRFLKEKRNIIWSSTPHTHIKNSGPTVLPLEIPTMSEKLATTVRAVETRIYQKKICAETVHRTKLFNYK